MSIEYDEGYTAATAECAVEIAALVQARDTALQIAVFNKKEAEKQHDLLLAAQHRIKVLRGFLSDVLECVDGTPAACQLYAEINETLAAP